LSIHVEEILKGVPADAKQRVSAIVDSYRERVREAVKDAVLLSFGGRGLPRRSVAVELRDDTPRIVSEMTIQDDLGAALTAHRATLAASADCMALLAEIPHQLSIEIVDDYRSTYPSGAAQDVARFLEETVARIDRANLVERILKIDEDYLGVYEPAERSGTIGIYWGLIALCAPRLEVSVEALALKVLAHEYAHAISHLGMDANGNQWEADSFLRADRFVQEGLANYFSWCALKSSSDWWMQEALRALEAIWPLQPPPYAEFDVWRKTIKAPQESVRNALRQARQIANITGGEFRNLLSR
jgi:hypothetical protein